MCNFTRYSLSLSYSFSAGPCSAHYKGKVEQGIKQSSQPCYQPLGLWGSARLLLPGDLNGLPQVELAALDVFRNVPLIQPSKSNGMVSMVSVMPSRHSLSNVSRRRPTDSSR